MTDRSFLPFPAFNARQGFVFFSAIAAAMLVCAAVPRALSFLPGVVAALGLCWFYVLAKQGPRIDRGLLIFLCAFLGLMMASCLWAPDPSFSFERSLKTIPVFIGGFAFLTMAGTVPSLQARDKITVVLALLCSLVSAALYFEYSFGFHISRFLLGVEDDNIPKSMTSGFLINRNMVYVVLLYLPVCLCVYASGLALSRKICLFVLMAATLMAALYVTESQTAQIAAALAVLSLLYPAHNKIARRFLTASVVAVLLVTPFLPRLAYDQFFASSMAKQEGGISEAASIPHRLEVWNFMATEIWKEPLHGHGVEATRFLRSQSIMPHMKTDQVLHPHNAALQIWLEFGLIGGVLACCFVIFLLRKTDGLPRVLQHYYIMLFLVVMGVLSTGYGLWQGWQVGMIMAIPAFSAMATNLYSLKSRA